MYRDLLRHEKLVFLLLALIVAGACNHAKAPAEADLKHYQLTGRVVAIDKANKSLTVDGDEIPGFMAAMQMPYDVKDASLLDKLASGDKIAAEIIVKGDESWLENIKVMQRSPATNPASSLRKNRVAA